MNTLIIPIINKSNNPLPTYATEQSAGMDLRANLSTLHTEYLVNCNYTQTEEYPDGILTINPGGRALVPTGLHLALPEGYEAQVRPRSGLALKHGITVLNTPGTIDADYRGEIGIVLINLDPFTSFVIKQGDRIAQMIISRHEICKFNEVESLDETSRGEGGFNHTGVK